MASTKVALVVNQDAGKAAGKIKLLRKLAHKYDLKLKLCDGPDLDFTLRQTLENKKLKRLIIGGGDGSVSLAASLVLRLNPKVQVAVLPVGTANYYAKSLGVQRSVSKAFVTALGEATEKRHLCQANKRDFLLGLNIGATSHMFKEVTDKDKQRFGKIAYFKGVLQVLKKIDAPDVEIHANGEVKSYASTELVVLNQHIHEPVHLMPKVRGSEPHFEIIMYGLGKSKLSPLIAVVIFALSLGRNQKYLKRIKTTKATIKTRRQQPVAIDGDSLEQTPVEIELIKKPILFICGPKTKR